MSKLLATIGLSVILLTTLIYMISTKLPVKDQLKKADAIIAISGGDTMGRTNHAIEIYKAGWANTLIFSGAAKDPNSPSNAAVMKNHAIKQGVLESAVITEESARDTKENAAKIKRAAPHHKKIILVTSPYHQRRAYKEFKATYGDEVTIINSPAKDKNWNPKTWWLTPYGWWVSLTETVRLLF